MSYKSWKKVRLADICEAIDYGYTTSASEDPVGPKFLRITDIVNGSLDWSQVPYCQIPSGKEENYRLHSGDIVIARTGATTGESAYIQKPPHAVFASYLIRLRTNSSADARFVSYFLKTSHFRNYVRGIAGGKSAQPNASASAMSQIAVLLPPLAEQRAIAEILGSLDDKIELNRQMNATLEAIARAIFTSWFVDFDPVHAKAQGEAPAGMDAATAALFPDAFVESELGPIPAGWEAVKMKALGSLDHNRLTPQDYVEETFDYFSIPAYKEDGMPELEVGAEIKSSKYLVPEGCVLLSRLNPRFPRVWLPFLEGNYRAICSTEFLVVMPKAGMIREYLYTLFNMDNFRHRFENLVTGTSGSHQRVKQRSFLNMRVVKPPPSVVDAFTDVARPIYEKIAQNQFESQTLAELRDTLLPKLISGELRLPEFMEKKA